MKTIVSNQIDTIGRGMPRLSAPFPFAGDRAAVTDTVWERLGSPTHYIEPFAGSMATLLGRQSTPRLETVNDTNGFICNFWRAVQYDYDGVLSWASAPAMESELRARRISLDQQEETLVAALEADPTYFSARIAGYWLYCVRFDIDPGFELPAQIEALSFRLAGVRVMCGDWARVVTPAILRERGPIGVFIDLPKKGLVVNEVLDWCLRWDQDKKMRIAVCGAVMNLSQWESVTVRGNNRADTTVWFSPHCLPSARLFR